jgi:hypothetical protein
MALGGGRMRTYVRCVFRTRQLITAGLAVAAIAAVGVGLARIRTRRTLRYGALAAALAIAWAYSAATGSADPAAAARRAPRRRSRRRSKR